MSFLKKVSADWVLTIILFITLATVGFTGTRIVQLGEDAKTLSQENQRFLVNFDSYMQCLVVNDPEVVEALGVEAYFEECRKLLFEGTGLAPKPTTRVTIPSTTTTTTTE